MVYICRSLYASLINQSAAATAAVPLSLSFHTAPRAIASLASWHTSRAFPNSHQQSFFSTLTGTPSVTPAIEARLDHICNRHAQLVTQLGGPEGSSLPPQEMGKLNKELSDLESVVHAVEEWRSIKAEVASLDAISEDMAEEEAMRELALEERNLAVERIPVLERALLLSLLPRDAADERGVVVEVRAGTGGEEACLFAGELFRMYDRYSFAHGWKFEVAEYSASDLGGCKLASATVSGGAGIYGRLKFESGVHRVQRVPATESGGRVHTSAASVAVLPQAEDVDITIKDEEIRIDVYRAGGAGGQHVNTTNSAVRVTHLPSGLSVAIQDERSQHKNKAKALSVLRARLFDVERRRAAAAQSSARKQQMGSGDRSERVRTYNFPQGRVTDHRVGVTEHGMEAVLAGEKLDPFIQALQMQHQAELLSTLDE